ncbi:MAG TPA: alanine racemase [Nitrospira sp.]|nr:alanine racemase [Nitrospira sp.]
MSITSNFHPTYATVDLTALAKNLSQLRRILSPSCDIMPVVKANAYGHGAIQAAQTLIQHGVTRLAVFSTAEGVVLRQAGVTVPIVTLGPVFPQQINALFSYRLTPVVSDCSTLESIAQHAASQATRWPIHLKVETGMGRLGLSERELESVINTQKFPSSLHLEGLMSHFADSDGPDSIATEEQLRRFNRAIRVVVDGGFHVPLIHLANSGGVIRVPSSHFTLVRPGIMLYGYHTLPSTVPAPDLQPVLSLTTHIAQLRTIQPGGTVSYNQTFTAQRLTRIAILPIGYADGLSRRLSNRGHVLIRGQRVPIVGLVCMDMVMVDVTTLPDTTIGDEVVLIGQQGNERLTAGDIAQWAGTISYEVLCAISPKIPRLYHPS